MELFSRIELSQGKIKVRDLYISNDYILPIEYLYSEKDIALSSGKTNELISFIEKCGKKAAYVALPYKTYVYNYMLPSYLQSNYSEQNYNNFIKALHPDIKTCDAFRAYENHSINDLESYFFKADFHWNAKGAGEALLYTVDWLFSEKLIDEPKPEALTFDYTYLDDNYIGDLNRRYSFLFSTRESIPIFKENESEIRYFSSYNSEDYSLNKASIKGDALPEGQTYDSVYTKNAGYYKMVNDNSLLNTKVLVIKDSMQNPMTGMFSYLFNTSEIVDIRALKELSLFTIIEESNADLVLLMYHQNNVTGEMFDFK
ncbi:MAG: hypothetical protein GX625_13735 [Clostridiaceae bacterium]|nr:hypothetical protein [Clostridiaceae bacterium]